MIVTIMSEQKEYDIMTDPENQIQHTLQILIERGLLSKEVMDCKEIYSIRRRRKISVESTYNESGIYQGDILRIK